MVKLNTIRLVADASAFHKSEMVTRVEKASSSSRGWRSAPRDLTRALQSRIYAGAPSSLPSSRGAKADLGDCSHDCEVPRRLTRLGMTPLAKSRALSKVRTMKLFLCTLMIVVGFGQMEAVRASDASHRAAAEALLNLMDMDNLLNQSIDQMLEMQVKQNPAIGQYQTQMKAFLSKYMSWASMKEDMIKIYMDEFSEQELKELLAFYQTPLGKKTVQKMPKLMAKGAEMGQQRVQQHLPELQQAIQEQATKKTP